MKTVNVDAETHALLKEYRHRARAETLGVAVRLALASAMQTTAEA